MADEKKSVSLSDLGLIEEKTPAQISEEAATQKYSTETVEDNGNTIEVVKVNPNDLKLDDEPVKPKKFIPRPNAKVSDNEEENATELNIRDIATKPRVDQSVEKVKENLNNLYTLADKNIERNEQDLMRRGGLIEEGKRKYVEDRYNSLVKRSKKSKNLAKKIDFYNNVIDTDPAFDGIDEYERKGYILYKVAHDNSIGIDDKSFGLSTQSIKDLRVTSKEANDKINKMTGENDLDTSHDNDDLLVLNHVDTSNIPMVKRADIEKQDEEKSNKISVEIAPDEKPEDKMDIGDDPLDEVDDSSKELITVAETDDFDDEDKPKKKQKDMYMEEFGVSEKEYQKLQREFLSDAADKLNINRDTSDYSSFEIGTHSINLNNAFRIANAEGGIVVNKAIWPLQYTGVPIEATPLSGNELAQFTDEVTKAFQDDRGNRKNPTINQLRSIYTTLYNHTIMANKPSFNTWLNQISSNDFNSLVMAQYNVLFKDCNFITYHCPKKGCSKIFLEKKDIMDMLEFPNDETKENFNKILNKDSVSTKLYRTEPVPINNIFAISFITPSIYSNNFEQAALSDSFKEKNNSIINIMQVIDRVYVIDRQNNKYLPIDFGIIPNDLEKTVTRKVKALTRIFSTFTPDDRSIIFSEFSKIIKHMSQDEIKYKIPKTVCPLCGTEIEEEYTDPMGLLFTRAQLSIEVASIRALS